MRTYLLLILVILVCAGIWGYRKNPQASMKLASDVGRDTVAIFTTDASTNAAPAAVPPPAPSTAANAPLPVVAPTPTPAPAAAPAPAPHYSMGFQTPPPANGNMAPVTSTPAATPAPAIVRPTPMAVTSPTLANLPQFTDYDQALAAAKQDHAPLLILFTGSDWCPYCQKLDQEVLSKDEFQQYLKSHYVFLTIDDLKHTILPQDDVQKIKDLEQKFKVTGFPTLLMIDSNEHEKGRTAGYDPGSGVSAVENDLNAMAAK